MNLSVVALKPRTKIVFSLFILLLLDLLRPLGYSLCIEFLFLGIIFLALNQRLLPALLLSLVMGYLKDCLGPSGRPLAVIEFPLLCVFVRYFLARFLFVRSRRIDFFIKLSFVVLLLLAHTVINSLASGRFFLPFSFSFIFQSLVFYFFLNYVLKSWITPNAPIPSELFT